MTKVSSPEQCASGDCEYKICMKLELGGTCRKDAVDTVSHTCEKPDNECLTGGGFSASDDEIADLPNGYDSCQVVAPGGKAEFLLKDGNAKDGCGSSDINFLGGYSASCQTYGSECCTGRGNVGKECMWSIEAPMDCNAMGGGVVTRT